MRFLHHCPVPLLRAAPALGRRRPSGWHSALATVPKPRVRPAATNVHSARIAMAYTQPLRPAAASPHACLASMLGVMPRELMLMTVAALLGMNCTRVLAWLSTAFSASMYLSASR